MRKPFLKLNPALFAIALDGAINESHAAHARHNPRQCRRQRVLASLLPRDQRIGKLAIENRECLQIALGMARRSPANGKRIRRSDKAPRRDESLPAHPAT